MDASISNNSPDSSHTVDGPSGSLFQVCFIQQYSFSRSSHAISNDNAMT